MHRAAPSSKDLTRRRITRRAGGDSRARRAGGRPIGFTLIEVLVVVAILALLAAILLPSLRRAREQAKVAICKANCRQIATIIDLYRHEEAQYVPILFNYYANGDPRHRPNPAGHNVPAKGSWLSVALRRFDAGTRNLHRMQSRTVPGRFFDPEVNWGGTQGCMLRDEFESRLMPEYYACPFERGRDDGEEIQQTIGTVQYIEMRGRFDSYHTWLWSDIIIRNRRIQTFPGGVTEDGVVKYSALTWNRLSDPSVRMPAGQTRWDDSRPDNPYFHRYHRRWTPSEARVVERASLSEFTVSWCAQGEHLALGNLRYNVGSHRGSQGGGSNAIFADSHVEWVKGTRIGWR
jgi:prepilin-type N-terminal cleavage/methylation domain-containing protein